MMPIYKSLKNTKYYIIFSMHEYVLQLYSTANFCSIIFVIKIYLYIQYISILETILLSLFDILNAFYNSI